MRIAVIAPPWVPVPPPAYGGTETVLDNLCRGLMSAGHDVLLVTTGDSTCPVPIHATCPQAAGTEAAFVATELHHVVRAYDAVAAWGADVVHDHTLVGPLHGERLGIPVVTTNHGPFEGELGELYRAIGASVPIIAISHHQAGTAHPSAIAAVIHHGVDVERFPFGQGDGGYALFLGRMNPDKGVATAIRVARAAGMPLRIAAKCRERPERAYFETEVAPLLGDDVEYLGEVGGAAKAELLAGARCLLNPIAWPEPFGMVMIEAMACGTPVVATPCGSVPELVTDGVTGFVRSGEEGLAEALARVGDLERAACRAEAEQRFSTSRMVDEHVAVYESVAATRQPLLVA
jgi:glycosyltransferase involved in cell wall biosynthesis